MNVRSDIAELLRAGWSGRKIAAHCQVSISSVRKAREALNLPAHKPGPTPAGTVEDLFWRRVEFTVDGHILWPNASVGIRTGHDGPRISAARLAFRIRHQREPVGKVTPGCGRARCVAPAHVEDRPMRDALNTQYTAIFGGVL